MHSIPRDVPAGASLIRNFLIGLFGLAQGCATVFALGVGATSGGVPPPMCGTFLDLMLLAGGVPGAYGGNYEGATILRILAGLDLLPSFALDVALLPITFPVYLIFY